MKKQIPLLQIIKGSIAAGWKIQTWCAASNEWSDYTLPETLKLSNDPHVRADMPPSLAFDQVDIHLHHSRDDSFATYTGKREREYLFCPGSRIFRFIDPSQPHMP